MDMHISADFEIGSWDEKPFDEAVGVAKLTRASVTKTYTVTSTARRPPNG